MQNRYILNYIVAVVLGLELMFSHAATWWRIGAVIFFGLNSARLWYDLGLFDNGS